MADTVEKLVLDASGFVGGAQDAVDAFRAMSGASGEVQQSFQILNKSGELVRIGLKQVTDAGQIMTSTLRQTKEGWEANNIKIAQTNSKLRELAKEAKTAADALRATQGAQSASSFVQGLGLNPVNPAQLNAIRQVQTSLANALSNPASGGTAGMAAMFENLKRGVVSAETGVRASMQNSLINVLKLQEGFDTLGKKGQQSANIVGLSWGSIIRLLAVTTIRHIFLDFIASMREAATAAAELQAKVGLISALNQNVGSSVTGLTQQFGALANEFNRPVGDVAAAALEGVRSGIIRTSQDMNVLSESLRLSQITGATTANSMTTLQGVIRSFGLQTGDSTRVVNQLFALAQNGGNLDKIGQPLQNVGVIAHRLGISLEEVFQSFAILRQRGNSDTESVSQLQALFIGLERTTPRLTEALRQNGFASIQALIAEKQLGGALEFIKKNADDADESFRRFLTSRRAVGGLTFGAELSRGNGQFDDSAGNAQAAARAQQIVQQTTTFQQEFNKIATALATEIGPRILEAFKTVGGFSATVISIYDSVSRLAPLIAEIANGFAIWARGAANVAESVGLISKTTRESVDATRALGVARRESDAAFTRTQSDQRAAFQEQERLEIGVVATVFKGRNQALNEQARLANDAVTRTRDSAVASAKSVISSLQGVLGGFESNVKRSENAIEESLKRVSSFADKTATELFNSKLRAAGQVSTAKGIDTSTSQGRREGEEAGNLFVVQAFLAEQQGKLIKDRIASLTQEANALFIKGDETSIASARRKFEEIRHLQQQQFDIQDEQARRAAIFSTQMGGGGVVGFNADQRAREAALRGTDNRESALEESLRAKLAAQATELEKIVKLQRERVTETERAVQHASQFRLTDASGNLEQRFGGRTGEANAIREIDTAQNNAISTIRAARAQMVADIDNAEQQGIITREQAERQRRTLPSESDITRVQAQFTQERNALIAQLNTERQRVDLKAQQEKLIETIKANTQALLQRQQQVAETRETGNNALGNLQEILNNFRNNGEPSFAERAGNELRSGNLQELRTAFVSALDNAQAGILRAQRPGATPEDRTNAATLVGIVTRAFQAVQEERGRITRDANGNLNPNSDVRNINAATSQANTLLTANTENANQVLTLLLQGLNQSAVTQAAQNIANAGDAMARIPEIINQLLPVGNNQQQGPNEEGFAFGGLIGNNFSSMGPDNRMIRAKTGEFVVNPDSTRKFYSTLVAINRGDNPRGGGYSSGGSVTNTIGTMNFHVSGAGSPEQTARVIMDKIRREQRRGNI